MTSTKLAVTINDLVAEYEVRHEFRNESDESIEVIYSFPIPLDAAFMGMEATIAGELLIAQVISRDEAVGKYDGAVADGDSAILLELLERGVLCLNLGNLLPGETGEIVLRFATQLGAADGKARFSLPLVHRPRYGRSGLKEFEALQHDVRIEHPFTATIRIEGLLAHAPLSCTSHNVLLVTEGGSRMLQLDQGMLDRDLVVIFELPDSFCGRGRLVNDGEAAIGLVTLTTPLNTASPLPCDICLVLDGSGSMSGNAITQSRDALRAFAGQLRDDDRVQVLRFGSDTIPLFRRALPATKRVRDALVTLSETIHADLGGTSMGTAIQKAIDSLLALPEQEGRCRAIILVTDGAVHPRLIEEAQARAIAEKIRVFVVAVGSSAGVEVLQPLAAATSALLERAVPAEPIDEAVMRHLRRARNRGPLAVEIDWGDSTAHAVALGAIYPGDAVTAIATFSTKEERTVRMSFGDGVQEHSFHLKPAGDAPALRALAGHMVWRHTSLQDRELIALHYGLITPHTSAILVKARAKDAKAEGLPRILTVPQMMPDGMITVSAKNATRYPSTHSGRRGVAMSIISPRSIETSHQMRSADAEQREAVATSQALQPERELMIQIAIRDALQALLAADTTTVIDLPALLSEIDSALHSELESYLADLGVVRGRHLRLDLLVEYLEDDGIKLDLTDDQCAMLAVVMAFP